MCYSFSFLSFCCETDRIDSKKAMKPEKDKRGKVRLDCMEFPTDTGSKFGF